MNGLVPIFERELYAYFRSPVAYVFIIVFLMASTSCTFSWEIFTNLNKPVLKFFLVSSMAISLPHSRCGHEALG